MMQYQMKKQPQYNAAIYCRLSRDDGAEALSQSIVSQKESLTKYVEENGWNLVDVYIDDGYSGTNFNRPAFKEMLSAIEDNKINCVITKDLSRLGRNYLQTGYYTEEYFPIHNVRYIAINDGYDSLDGENDFTPFKNIINEWYAKDISKKIKTSIKHRQKEGTLIVNSPYGYKQDKEKGRLIDPKTAPVVEFIFTEYVEGATIIEIADKLTKKKILIPKIYRLNDDSITSNLPDGYKIEDTYKWSRGMIYSILNEYQYTGALICNKSHHLSFKNKKQIRNSKQEYIIHEDKFEPIISKDLYEQAMQKLNTASKAQIPLYINKYNGILYCGECGRKATFLRNDSNPNGIYKCRVSGCKDKRVSIDDLDEIIKLEILTFKDVVLANENKVLAFLKKTPQNENNYNYVNEELIDELETEKEKLMKSLAEAFEAKCNGEIPTSVYETILNDFNARINDINSKLDLIKNNKTGNDYNIPGAVTFINNIKGFNKYSKITRSMLITLIKRIDYYHYILDGKKTLRFEITYAGIDWLVKDFGQILN